MLILPNLLYHTFRQVEHRGAEREEPALTGNRTTRGI
jgi:hypothetical protein